MDNDNNKVVDGRKSNGGHSTKAIGVDKRKNLYRHLINEAVSESNFLTIMKTIEANAMEGDLQSAKLYLEYTAGKPLQGIDITSDGNSVSIPTINFGNIVSRDLESEDV